MGYGDPKLTREQRTLRQKVVDDCEGIETMLYSLLKFTVEIRLDVDRMKGLQEAIKSVQSHRRDVESDLKYDSEK